MPKLSGKHCCLIGLSACCLPFLGLVIFLAIATTRGFGQYPPGIESAVFSNDNNNNSTRVAGIEIQWNKGIHPIPLQGWIGSVRPRSRVFLQESAEDIESRRYFDTVYSSQPDIMYFMESAGYILLGSEPANTFTMIDIEDGSTRVGPKDSGVAIPSPDGSVLATYRFTGDWTDRIFQFAFLDSTTLETISTFDPVAVQLPRAHRYVSYWNDDDDDNNESFSLATVGYDLPDGFSYENEDYDDDAPRSNTIALVATWNVDGQLIRHNSTSTTAPSCLPPTTSSSRYREDGGYLYINWTTEELGVVLPGMDNYPSTNYSLGEWYLC